MDLNRVHSYDIQPGQGKNGGTLMIDNLTLTNTSHETEVAEKRIWFNQLGYEKSAPKRFIVADSAEQPFTVFNENNKPLFTGTLDSGSIWDLSGDYLRQGTLAGVAEGETLSVLLHHSGERQNIYIGKGIYRLPFLASLKAFYYQRSGVALEKPFADRWVRPAGHPDTACSLHVSTGKKGIVNVRGGWYDAGDYGKYIVPAGVSVWLLLAFQELFPAAVSDSLSIPESGNGVCDLLDEVQFELEWMKRMQDADGGVFFKVGTLTWDGFSMPHECNATRYVIGKSTASTLVFAGAMAKAARAYRNVNRTFADDYRTRALKSWQWATANPEVREPTETGGTGAYGDNAFGDEFFWAACELYLTTGRKKFRSFILRNSGKNGFVDGASWSRVNNFGWLSLLANSKSSGMKLNTIIRKDIITTADRLVGAINRHACRIPTEQFIWGSNDVLLNQAVTCCYAHILTGKTVYRDAVLDIVDYILGRNATGYSFVTGFGARSPRYPHHRIMGSDDIDDPFPGFLVGGPNGEMQDAARGEPGVYYPKTAPACAYIDRVESYASNEIAINWNAALVFVLGFLSESL
jgi:endoglucanase